MRGKKVPCPACAELMTISGDAASSRVSCPHCQSAVALPGPSPKTETSEKHDLIRLPEEQPDLDYARDLLRQILQQARSRQAALKVAASDLQILEARANSLRQWLEKLPTGETPDWWNLVFQCRLFTRLSSMPTGLLEIRECGPGTASSLAAIIRDAFVAAGWRVSFSQIAPAPGSSGLVVFSIGSGPMNHQVAVVHLALTLCGLHLQSVINHEQPDHAILIIHGAFQLLKSPSLEAHRPALAQFASGRMPSEAGGTPAQP